MQKGDNMAIGQILILVGLCWFCYLLVTVIKKPGEWPTLVQILPLLAFLNYARCFDLSEACWPYAFILAGFVALVVTITLASLNILMDRMLLGVNLFFILGGIAFAANLNGILNLLGEYKGGFFLGSILIVGIVTTLFTRTGFLAIEAEASLVTKGSWMLVALNCIAVVWAVFFVQSGLLWSTVLPFVGVRMARETLVNMIEKKKIT